VRGKPNGTSAPGPMASRFDLLDAHYDEPPRDPHSGAERRVAAGTCHTVFLSTRTGALPARLPATRDSRVPASTAARTVAVPGPSFFHGLRNQPACIVHLALRIDAYPGRTYKMGPGWIVDADGIDGRSRCRDSVGYHRLRGWVRPLSEHTRRCVQPQPSPRARAHQAHLTSWLTWLCHFQQHSHSEVDYLCLSYVWGSRT